MNTHVRVRMKQVRKRGMLHAVETDREDPFFFS